MFLSPLPTNINYNDKNTFIREKNNWLKINGRRRKPNMATNIIKRTPQIDESTNGLLSTMPTNEEHTNEEYKGSHIMDRTSKNTKVKYIKRKWETQIERGTLKKKSRKLKSKCD